MCIFEEEDGYCACVRCGRRMKKHQQFSCDKHHASCKNESKPNGLGDRIEHWLSSYGVTQEKYKEVKQKFGLPATCGCDGRKEWFNKVGAYFGIDPDRYGPHKETK